MNLSELQSKLDELTREVNDLCERLGLPTNPTENIDNEDEDWEDEEEDEDWEDEEEDDDWEDEEEDEEEDDDWEDEEEDEEEDDDIDGACGVGFGIDISKLFDPRYNEHILSEPDENGMVEISDELYDRLYGKYHSKEDMLDDIVRELDFYISGKYVGDEEYWAETRYLGINKESNRPQIGTMDELNEEDCEFDIYDIKEFEQCYWTNANDKYADIFEYKLVNDKTIRNLIDKYYPELPW